MIAKSKEQNGRKVVSLPITSVPEQYIDIQNGFDVGSIRYGPSEGFTQGPAALKPSLTLLNETLPYTPPPKLHS